MRSRFLLLSLGLVILTFLAHGPGLGGDWVYDDHRFIRLNPARYSNFKSD